MGEREKQNIRLGRVGGGVAGGKKRAAQFFCFLFLDDDLCFHFAASRHAYRSPPVEPSSRDVIAGPTRPASLLTRSMKRPVRSWGVGSRQVSKGRCKPFPTRLHHHGIKGFALALSLARPLSSFPHAGHVGRRS